MPRPEHRAAFEAAQEDLSASRAMKEKLTGEPKRTQRAAAEDEITKKLRDWKEQNAGTGMAKAIERVRQRQAEEAAAVDREQQAKDLEHRARLKERSLYARERAQAAELRRQAAELRGGTLEERVPVKGTQLYLDAQRARAVFEALVEADEHDVERLAEAFNEAKEPLDMLFESGTDEEKDELMDEIDSLDRYLQTKFQSKKAGDIGQASARYAGKRGREVA